MRPLSGIWRQVIQILRRGIGSGLIRNIGWNVLGSAGAALISPIFAILTARLLVPEDYGTFSIALGFLAFVTMSRDLGLSQAVIVNQESKNYFSIHFTFQFAWAFVLAIFIMVAAPIVSKYYGNAELKNVLMILAIIPIIYSFVDPYLAQHLKNQNYRAIFFRQIFPSLLSGSAALYFAYSGYGVYSLVIGNLINAVAAAGLVVAMSSVQPKMIWDLGSFRKLMRLGKHMVIQEFFGLLVTKADALVIGKNLGFSPLGNYQMGNNIICLVSNLLTAQTSQVVFTDVSKNYRDLDYINRRYYQFVYYFGIIGLAASVLLFTSAPFFVSKILGPHWVGAQLVIQALSLVVPVVPLVVLNNHISKIFNFSHCYTYYSALRALITIALVTIASFYSLFTVLVAYVVSGIFGAIFNSLLFFSFQKIIRLRPALIVLFFISSSWGFLGLLQICFLLD